MTAAELIHERDVLINAVFAMRRELKAFRALRKTPGELKEMLRGTCLSREHTEMFLNLWFELDKCLYFGLEFCDMQDVKKLHEQLREFVEQKQFDAVC